VDAETGEIVNRQLKRAIFLEHFANREPCLIGMEACGGAQHWARRLVQMGHQVKLMPAKFVKAFVIGNKNDPADARAIWMFLPGGNADAKRRVEAVRALLGPVPKDVFMGQAQPRHSKRRRPLLSEPELRLLDRVPLSESTDEAQAVAQPLVR
jgi:transposase